MGQQARPDGRCWLGRCCCGGKVVARQRTVLPCLWRAHELKALVHYICMAALYAFLHVQVRHEEPVGCDLCWQRAATAGAQASRSCHWRTSGSFSCGCSLSCLASSSSGEAAV